MHERLQGQMRQGGLQADKQDTECMHFSWTQSNAEGVWTPSKSEGVWTPSKTEGVWTPSNAEAEGPSC